MFSFCVLNKETAAIWSFRSASTVSKRGYLDVWAPFETMGDHKQVGAEFFVCPSSAKVKAEPRAEELECGIH